MYLQILVEDVSGGKLLESIIDKYKAEIPDSISGYSIRAYKGIGGLPHGSNAKNIKIRATVD